MKSRIVISLSVLVCAGIVAGCGQNKAERQRAIKEVQATKQKSNDASGELDAANQKIASLNSSMSEQEKLIQSLNGSVAEAEASNAAKQARIDRLMNPEETALADADTTYKAGDKGKALMTYKAFARDFPLSSKSEFAQARIKELSQAIAHEKWVAEAPMRAAQARNALLQSAYNEGFATGQRTARIWSPGNNRAARQLGIEDSINAKGLNDARDTFQTSAMYQKYPNNPEAFRAYMKGYDAGVASVGGGSFNYN